MRKSALVLLFLVCGTISAAGQPSGMPSAPTHAKGAVGEALYRRIVQDQDKLGKTYTPHTRSRLKSIAARTLTQLPNLPAKANLRDLIQKELRQAFPQAAAKGDQDAMVFWIVAEISKSVHEDMQELTDRKNLADERDRQAEQLLAQVHKRLGDRPPASLNTPGKPKPVRKPPAGYTRHMRIGYGVIPEIKYTAKDIEQAEGDELQSIEADLSSAKDDSQLARIDLQKVRQDYEQALQTISAILRAVHDDAMEIISNLRN